MGKASEGEVIRLRAAVHPTAFVHPEAVLEPEVEIGPYAQVGARAWLGQGSWVGPRAWVGPDVCLGKQCRIYGGARVGVVERLADLAGAPGSDPAGTGSHLHGSGPTTVVGDLCVVREYATVRAGLPGSPTRMGTQCYVMSYVLVEPGCQLGEQVVLTHRSVLHEGAVVGDRAIISGLCSVERGIRVGRGVMVGGLSRVSRHVPPFLIVRGDPAQFYGVNIVGLRRGGMPPGVRDELRQVFRVLFRSGSPSPEALGRLREQYAHSAEIQELLDFVAEASPLQSGAEEQG